LILQAAGGRPNSSHLGTECGESGSATTALASALDGTDPNRRDEPVAGGKAESRAAL